MRTNICKNQALFPSREGRAEFQTTLLIYLESHSAEETQELLTDLLQGWVNPERLTGPDNMDIANMVFFVSNLTIMVRKVSAFKGLAGHVTDLIEALPPEYVEELLNEVLQAWICPCPYTCRSLERIADAVSAFRLLTKLVTKLECIVELEGGMLCN
jgi:hypothetical protein